MCKCARTSIRGARRKPKYTDRTLPGECVARKLQYFLALCGRVSSNFHFSATVIFALSKSATHLQRGLRAFFSFRVRQNLSSRNELCRGMALRRAGRWLDGRGRVLIRALYERTVGFFSGIFALRQVRPWTSIGALSKAVLAFFSPSGNFHIAAMACTRYAIRSRSGAAAVQQIYNHRTVLGWPCFSIFRRPVLGRTNAD